MRTYPAFARPATLVLGGGESLASREEISEDEVAAIFVARSQPKGP
jgi:hypothetical protein